jgi:hypothetical protein
MCSNPKKVFTLISIHFFTTLFACSMDDFSTGLIGHYSGTLPCADCPGIIINFDLKEKAKYSSEMIYMEKEQTFEEDGVWKVINEKDLSGEKMVLIELSPYHSSNKTYYRVKNNTTLQLLDANKNAVPSAELKKRVD